MSNGRPFVTASAKSIITTRDMTRVLVRLRESVSAYFPSLLAYTEQTETQCEKKQAAELTLNVIHRLKTSTTTAVAVDILNEIGGNRERNSFITTRNVSSIFFKMSNGDGIILVRLYYAICLHKV